MEDFDDPPTSRLQKNLPAVVIATLLAAIGWFFASKSLATANCPGLRWWLLLSVLGVCWLLCLRALVFGPDGPIEQGTAIILMLALGLGLPGLGGGVLSDVQWLRNTFCECATRESIEDQIETFPDAAFDSAKKCGDTALDLQIRALLSWSDQLVKKNDCIGAKDNLDTAESLATRLPDTPANKQLKERIREKKTAIKNSQQCGPTPIPTATPLPSSTPSPAPTAAPTATEEPTATPTPTPVLAITLLGKRRGKGVIDFKLTADGTPVPDLSADEVTASNPSLKIKKLLPRSEKDPVCVIAVVDNSGSIKEQDLLRGAIQGLNDMQAARPSLWLGMIVFDTTIVQEVTPSTKRLDVKLITGKGQNTALWLGVDAGIKLASNCKEAPVLDRYLFVVTDGADNTGNKSKAEIIKAANDTGVGICTVGINSADLQQQPLIDVAAAGCAYRFAKDVETVRGLLQEILYDTGNSYRITADRYTCPVTLEVRGTSLEVCP